MSDPTQRYRFASIETILGEDRLLLRAFSGEERLGQTFEYSLTLLDQRPDMELDADDLIGSNATIRLQVESDEMEHTRYFNGFVVSLTFAGHHDNVGVYHARMVPWLWLLSRTSDCRSFQDKTVQQILEECFSDFGFKDFKFDLTREYPPKPFTVQYNETALNFVSRLMEHEGMYYWWAHENGKHTLMVTDDMSTHAPHPLKAEIQWRERSGVLEEGYLYGLRAQKNVISGSFALNDYNFKAPSDDLRSRLGNEKTRTAAKFERFEYPGYYRDSGQGEALSKVRLEEAQAHHEIIDAWVTARAIATGYLFHLTHAERRDQERDYLVTSTKTTVSVDSYTAGGSGGAKYDCQITAIPKTSTFRPARNTPKPLVRGPQPAVVVGPPNEEIHCDEYGRVKVQFYWDRRSKGDDTSSKWVRVSQASAGGEYGFMSLPRVGQEVLVEFMNGDPDQPIITGRVYNNENKHPYDPSSLKTRSSWKTNTYPGGGGFNELRFEDSKDKEQIFIHGQKDIDTRIREKTRAYTGLSNHLIVGTDSLEKVDQDKHATIMRHHTEEVKENHFLTTGGDDLMSVKKAWQVTSEESMRLETHGDTQIVTTGATGIASGDKVVIQAPSITLKGAGGFVKVDASGVTIVGNLILINSGGSPEAIKDVPFKRLDLPQEPEEAADSPAGKVEKSKGMGHQTTADAFPEQTVSDIAAQDGKPFQELNPATGGPALQANGGAGPTGELAGLIRSAIGPIKEAGNSLEDLMRDAVEAVQEAAGFASGAVREIGSEVRGLAEQVTSPVKELANAFKEAVKEVEDAVKEAQQAVQEVANTVRDTVKEAAETVTEPVKEIAAAVKDVATAVKETADSVKQTAEEAKTAVNEAIDSVKESVDTAIDDAVAPVKEAAGAIREATAAVKGGEKEVKNIGTGIGQAAKEAIQPVKDAKGALKEAKGAVKEARKSIHDALHVF